MKSREAALDATAPDGRTGYRWAWARAGDGRLFQAWRGEDGREGTVVTEDGLSVEVSSVPVGLWWRPNA